MELKTKKGRLTRYGLACGYVETFAQGVFSVRLDMPSPSAGVVRVIENGDEWRIAYNGKSLAAARRAFDNAKRAVTCPLFAVGDRVGLVDPIRCEQNLRGTVIARNARGLVRLEWDNVQPDGRGAPWYRPQELKPEAGK